MLFLLNYRYNQEKMKQEDERMLKKKTRKGDHKSKNESGGKSVTKNSKKKSKSKLRPLLFKDLPLEKKWEAVVIVSIGVGIPLLFGLYNLFSALYKNFIDPPVIVYNYTMPHFALNPHDGLKKMKELDPLGDTGCITGGIERRSLLSLKEFYNVYDAKWPVLITDCVPHWPAAKLWNEKFFISRYGKQRVTMSAVENGLDKAVSYALPLEIFAKHINKSSRTTWTYLQDEIFLTERPELIADVGPCDVLKEDFFSWFPEGARPWWAFFLWGTKYSRSHLHMDPYNWTGTNAVLSGRKRWKLFPPGQDHLLYVKSPSIGKFPLHSYKYNSRVDVFDKASVDKHPLVKEAHCLEFVQNPGELLIIPTGWFHQAFNDEVTMAISGQLMNRGNFRVILEELFKAGDLSRNDFRHDIESVAVGSQVREALKKLTPEVIEAARKLTSDVKNQVKHLDKSKVEL